MIDSDYSKLIEPFYSRVPDEVERVKVRSDLLSIIEAAEHSFKNCLNFLRIEAAGSVAKDTYWAGRGELDLFVVFKDGSIEENYSTMKMIIIDQLKPISWIEDYCTSQYLRTVSLSSNSKYSVDWVPCYDRTVGSGESKLDFTLMHTKYINSHLTLDQKKEVILLKLFLDSIGCYGAQLDGFSGYCCEVLVSLHNSCNNVLKWLELQDSIFKIPDPVNLERNIAASISQRIIDIVKDRLNFFNRGLDYSEFIHLFDVKIYQLNSDKISFPKLRKLLIGLNKSYGFCFSLSLIDDIPIVCILSEHNAIIRRGVKMADVIKHDYPFDRRDTFFINDFYYNRKCVDCHQIILLNIPELTKLEERDIKLPKSSTYYILK